MFREKGWVGAAGTGGTCPQDFAINIEVLFSFLENAPFYLRCNVPSKCRAPKFEMLPTSLFDSALAHHDTYVDLYLLANRRLDEDIYTK